MALGQAQQPSRRKARPGPNAQTKIVAMPTAPARPKFLTCDTSQIARDPSPMAVVMAANRLGQKTVLSIEENRSSRLSAGSVLRRAVSWWVSNVRLIEASNGSSKILYGVNENPATRRTPGSVPANIVSLMSSNNRHGNDLNVSATAIRMQSPVVGRTK